MQKGVLSVLLLLLSPIAHAQDTVSVSYSEETDTLVKQRFLDRYENVFMTKVPTRHMFKIGLSQYYQAKVFALSDDRTINSTSLHLGYEFKFLPAFSIALSGHIPYYDLQTPFRESFQNTVLDAQLRWFMNMGRRIRKGKSANNFSGNYLAVFYNMPSTMQDDPRIGLKLGFQRRFLNFGFMDFAVALQQGTPFFHYGAFYNWDLSTQASFGLAFGDWKKAAIGPLCDVFLCDEHLSNQWKIRLPELTLGRYMVRIRTALAFEQKIGTLPFSINFQLNADHSDGFNDIRNPEHAAGFQYLNSRSKEKFLSFSVQPRYYFLSKIQKLRGKGGHGFSGPYTGINMAYVYYKGEHRIFRYTFDEIYRKTNAIHVGPLLGYQLRVFRHGYVDCNTSYNFKDYLNSNKKDFGFTTNITVGIAF
ncbi:MAG: hypothetical protein J7619_09820 [Dyadobacter sp.]|uniref:hypothetical protein n=1 Tax=Dyadobacter sp. TaxID=1914288 RepID=UPI001B10DD7B|nr:hypothetical protein [Dyadobacter sp.]MBO9612982.1 hypothetical protein [Dyadobacter sp.]